MKNAIIYGLIIGILSGGWLFAMHWAGYDTQADKTAPFEYFSILIPVIGLYFGVRSYRENETNGKFGFLQAFGQSFKILIVAGVVAIAMGIWYVSYIGGQKTNTQDFSGRIFAALLIGVLSALAASLLLMTKPEQVD
ncbi:DUF4199 domain-containing protein [Mucilaginibacter ginkgonis]|uniref:DUF4199 domain-containing protein n=1 Tax=Mucilaginibacter ginkgonis TaxID=2682091 RepID=A0A6I4I1Z6_9SPHI|nr:DUF4199 domain-containing protein [Mucilaginibacter ginkgonis]QQL49320.1 DUF4199 domain-containing protein [Mucilaginibacter ginkgonis]